MTVVRVVLVLALLARLAVMLRRLGQWRELHHGLLLVLALMPEPTWLQVAGAVLGGDDVYQHERQRREPAYRSPVHRLAAALGLYRTPLYEAPR